MSTLFRAILFLLIVIATTGCKFDKPMQTVTVNMEGEGDIAPQLADTSIPTLPRASGANSMRSTAVFVNWSSAIDDVTPSHQLRYRVYIAQQKENLLSTGNLMLEVQGDETGRYEKEIDVSKLLSSDGADRTLQIAVVAVDGDGNEGQPSYMYDVEMMEQDIEIRTDIAFYFADEEGYPMPVRDGTDKFTLDFTSVEVALPEVGAFIAFDNGGLNEIIKVTKVANKIVHAEFADLSEIVTGPIQFSGAVNFARQPGDYTHYEITSKAEN